MNSAVTPVNGDRLENEIPERLLMTANELELNIAYETDDGTDHLVE